MKLFKQIDAAGKGKLVSIVEDGPEMIVENCRNNFQYRISSTHFLKHYKEANKEEHAREQIKHAKRNKQKPLQRNR